MSRTRTVSLTPFVDLSPIVGDGELVAFDIGPDGLLYLAVALRKLDDHESINGARFPKSTPDTPQDYRIVSLREGFVEWDITVRDEGFNIHFVKPLPQGEFLLANARSWYRSATDFDLNGRIYRADGVFKRGILLGGGISSVQTTFDGTIWTSYFDEGIFGNCGWNDPVGASGLVAWSDRGEKLYEFCPVHPLDHICDCYALNVPSNNEVWLSYYTEFPLVHLHDGRIAGHWNVPAAGSCAFAVHRNHVLMDGGYKRHNILRLFCLGEESSVADLATLELRDSDGSPIVPERLVARGHQFYLRCGSLLFHVDLAALVE